MIFLERRLGQHDDLREAENKKLSEYNQNLIELCEKCEDFEVRVSALEKNFDEKINELYTMHEHLGFDLATMNRENDVAPFENEIKVLKKLVQERALESEVKLLRGKIELFGNPHSPAVIPMANQQVPAPTAQPLPVMIQPFAGSLHDPKLFHRSYQSQPLTAAAFLGAPVIQPLITPVPASSVPQPPHVLPTFLPEDKYAILVGREGKTINKIREESGAHITIKEKRDKPPIKYYEVHYSGEPLQIAKAKTLVSDLLETSRHTQSPANLNEDS